MNSQIKIKLTDNLKHLRDKSGIYVLHFPNNKVYVGQSVDIYNRLNVHLSTARNNKNKNQVKLYRAFKKYGVENILIEIKWSTDRAIKEERITKNTLDKLEIQYINEYRAITEGYNTTSGGQNGLGYRYLSTSQRERAIKNFRKLHYKPSYEELHNMIFEWGVDETASKLKVSTEKLYQMLEVKDNRKALSENTRSNTNLNDKAVENKEALELVNKNYTYLRDFCVKNDNTEDIFHDTILYITYKYNPEIDFCTQFIKFFKYRAKMFQKANRLEEINIMDIEDCYSISYIDETHLEEERVEENAPERPSLYELLKESIERDKKKKNTK